MFFVLFYFIFCFCIFILVDTGHGRMTVSQNLFRCCLFKNFT